MTYIDMKDVTFKYKHELTLQQINLYEDEPDVTGIWGRNGAGKTTLMKLFSGGEHQ